MIALLTNLRSKAVGVFCIAVVTALIISILEVRSVTEKYDDLNKKYSEQVTLNERLGDQNLTLQSEIDKKPKEFITITKEVEVEICNGRVQQELIKSLPSNRGKDNDNKVEGNTADIDDRLPADLIKLLK